MEHAAFADLSNLQLVLTRFVYEDRRALPLAWRRALGFKNTLAAARRAQAGRASSLPAPQSPRANGAVANGIATERRAPGSRGAALRGHEGGASLAAAASTPAERRAQEIRKSELAPLLAAVVRAGSSVSTVDLSQEGLGRVQVFVRRRGERVDCVVLCAREARALVARALAQARELLARSGLALTTAPDGEAS